MDASKKALKRKKRDDAVVKKGYVKPKTKDVFEFLNSKLESAKSGFSVDFSFFNFIQFFLFQIHFSPRGA